MIDPERLLTASIGALVLFWLAFAVVIVSGVDWARVRHYWTVVIDQKVRPEDWQFLEGCKATLMIALWLGGW